MTPQAAGRRRAPAIGLVAGPLLFTMVALLPLPQLDVCGAVLIWIGLRLLCPILGVL